jgi:hypothetical protein
MGIDDESSHPELCPEVADDVTRNIVCLFREPDAGNLPVRFDEREQETELRQTGLRRARRKPPPIATGRLKPLRLFSTLLVQREPASGRCPVRSWCKRCYQQLRIVSFQKQNDGRGSFALFPQSDSPMPRSSA